MSTDTSRTPRTPLVDPGQIDHHVADMTVTVSADLTLQQLQNHLAKSEQWLPIDGDPQLPLTRLIGMNSSGPLRLGYGAWRDLLLGSQFTSESGQLISAGGRTMKNVAGYDLTKILIGSFGQFGKLLTLTSRTYRRPTHALLAKFPVSDKLVGQLLPTSARPHWAMLADGSIWCGYLGDQKGIDFHSSELTSRQPIELRRQSLQEDIDFRAKHWLPDRPPVQFRASVPLTQLSAFIRRSDLANFAADAAFGVVVGSIGAERKLQLRQIAEEVGGQVSFDDADDIRNFFGASSVRLELTRRIQSAFQT